MGSSSTLGMLDPRLNFDFGFNDTSLSDRVLNIEITANSLDSESDFKGRGCIPNVVEVKPYHVSSLLLAAHSPFFHKLFKNGMRESQQRDVTLRINVSEKAAFTDVLKFMYNNSLIATTVPDLLGVLIVAHKFEVTSCMRDCSEKLQKTPMKLGCALSYLELPPSVQMAEVVQPLIDKAKKYIFDHYDFFEDLSEVAMAFPLSAIEIILGSEGLQVTPEDVIFDFILKWARIHYPKLEERQEIFTKRLAQLICFPYMSCSKLKEVLVCPDICYEQVSKFVNEALLLKVDIPYGQHRYTSELYNQASTNYSFLRRVYMHHPVKVVQFELVQPYYLVYFNLKKEECRNLFPSGIVSSQAFSIGERWLFLLAKCSLHPQTLLPHFGLYVYTAKKSETCKVNLEFQVMKNPSKGFQCIVNWHNLTIKDCGIGNRNVLETSWTNFIRNNSDYFINGFLRLRVTLSVLKL